MPLPFWTNLFDQFYDPCSITTYMAPWEGTFNLKTFLPSINFPEKIKMLPWVVTSLYIVYMFKWNSSCNIKHVLSFFFWQVVMLTSWQIKDISTLLAIHQAAIQIMLTVLGLYKEKPQKQELCLSNFLPSKFNQNQITWRLRTKHFNHILLCILLMSKL